MIEGNDMVMLADPGIGRSYGVGILMSMSLMLVWLTWIVSVLLSFFQRFKKTARLFAFITIIFVILPGLWLLDDENLHEVTRVCDNDAICHFLILLSLPGVLTAVTFYRCRKNRPPSSKNAPPTDEDMFPKQDGRFDASTEYWIPKDCLVKDETKHTPSSPQGPDK